MANFETAARRGIDVCKRYFPYFTLYAVMIRKFGNRPRYEMSAIPATGDAHVCGIEFSPLLEGADYSPRSLPAIQERDLRRRARARRQLLPLRRRHEAVHPAHVRRRDGGSPPRDEAGSSIPAFILNPRRGLRCAGRPHERPELRRLHRLRVCASSGCPAYEETGFDVLTARGRNKALQAGLAAPEMVESIWACTLCGYCDAICPSDVHNVESCCTCGVSLPRRWPASPDRQRRAVGGVRLAGPAGSRTRAGARLHDPRARAAPHPVDRRVPAAGSAVRRREPRTQALLRVARRGGRPRAAVQRQGRRRRRSGVPRAVRRRVPRRAGHAASRAVRSRAAVLLLRAPSARESRPRAHVSALRRAPPPLRLRHELRSEPSGAIDVRGIGPGPLRASTRATFPPPSRVCWRTRGPSGSSPARPPTTWRSRPTRAARRASSRSACGERDRRPTSSSSARASPARRRPSARSTPAFARSSSSARTLPRHKICSGILSPRGYSFLRQNFGEPPDEAFHAPKWITGVNFLFPNGLQLPMPFIPGPTPHIYRKHADHHVVKESRAEVHERTEFRDLETRPNDVLVKARRAGADGRGGRLPGEVRHRRRRPAVRRRREAVSGVPRQHPLVRRRSEVLRRRSEPRSAVVPLHDQLDSSATTRGRTPRTAAHIVGYTGKHGDPWPKGHATAVEYLREAARAAHPRGGVEGRLHRELRHVADEQLRVRRAAGARHRPGRRVPEHDGGGHVVRDAQRRHRRRIDRRIVHAQPRRQRRLRPSRSRASARGPSTNGTR